ncbi:alkaline phosphatase [candidate division KSB1 bacterium]
MTKPARSIKRFKLRLIPPLLLAVALLSSALYAQAENVILLVGDGMGPAHVSAGRYELLGPEGYLSMEGLPVTGLVKTHSADHLITDSAASSTAMATGHKTNNGMIAVLPDGTPVATLMEAAMAAGKSAGVVTTTSVSHATPAAFLAHQRRRGDEDRIAEQMIASPVTIIFGGGLEFFAPKSAKESRRKDNRDLLAEAVDRGFKVARSKTELDKIDSGRILGLFENGGLRTGESSVSLADLTAKAISILAQNPKGYFLLIEGGQIDWESHSNDFDDMIQEIKDFDEAVARARRMTQSDRTLILVTADHETGGLVIEDGEPSPGSLDADWTTRSHSAVSVPIYAGGPGSELFTGVMDNTDIPRRIAKVLGLNFPAD